MLPAELNLGGKMSVSRTALMSALTVTTGFAHAGTDAWTLMEQIQIKEIVTDTTYEVQKQFPEDMEELGRDIKVTGYAAATIPGAMVDEIILVSDMGLCPLCGGGDHNANLQIKLAQPIPYFEEGTKMTLQGDLRKVLDPETWQSAILENARLVTG